MVGAHIGEIPWPESALRIFVVLCCGKWAACKIVIPFCKGPAGVFSSTQRCR